MNSLISSHKINKVALLTGGKDKPYNLGLLEGLIHQGLEIDFVSNDEMMEAEVTKNKLVNYLNLRGDQRPNVSLQIKIKRVLLYYLKLIFYAAKSDSKIFHIQWFNKFEFLDRTFLNLYYKLLGKIIIFTAHNINMRKRDKKDSLFNKISLKILYRVVDHIIVHTKLMKDELSADYDISATKISVIPFGINNSIPVTCLNQSQAREYLGIQLDSKVLLFFGNIAPYKGLEFLISALIKLKINLSDLRVIIAGRIKNCDEYWREINKSISDNGLDSVIIKKIEFIQDKDVEIYFKAADALVLPYVFIYQSGPLFLAYNFGLPVIATNVGSFSEDILIGKTGFLAAASDSLDLAIKIKMYFNSDLYRDLSSNREKIIKYATDKYSWNKIAKITYNLYLELFNLS